ncbi:hypothetical protein [Methanothrix sp.]|uniref:hypothetical protein n=1 Tax=Methanothrix sp. TaxID=90426 RepID=UPI003BB644AC
MERRGDQESPISENMLFGIPLRCLPRAQGPRSERYIARNMLFGFSVPRLSRYGASSERYIARNMLFGRRPKQLTM